MKWLIVLLFFTGCTIEVRPIKDKKPVKHSRHVKAAQPKPAPTPDLSRLAPVLRGAVAEIFSESDGKWSFARVFSALIIVTSLFLITFVTMKDGKIPDLAGPSLLMGVGVGLYTGNKVTTAITGDK